MICAVVVHLNFYRFILAAPGKNWGTINPLFVGKTQRKRITPRWEDDKKDKNFINYYSTLNQNLF